MPARKSPEPFVVEEDPARQAIYHRPLEAELGDGALELVGRRVGVGSGQRGKSGERIGMGAHCLVEAVVGAARQRHGNFCIDLLEPWHRVRDHLQVDTGLVHFLQPQCAEMVQAPHSRRHRGRVQTAGMLVDLGIIIMLLQSDDVGFHRHCFRRCLLRWTGPGYYPVMMITSWTGSP